MNTPRIFKNSYLVPLIFLLIAGPLHAAKTRKSSPHNRASSPASAPATTSRPAPAIEKVTSGMKAPLLGLVANKDLPPTKLDQVVKSAICMVYWKQLEPAEGQYDFSKIDACLDEAGRRGILVHLRLFCGMHSPEWLMKKAGKITFLNKNSNVKADTVQFWKPEVGDAYDRLQKALAERYDEDPRLVAITMSRCMTTYAEPFQRQISDKDTVKRLLDAGFNAEVDHRVQIETAQTHAKYWKHTRSSFAINPYQSIMESGTKLDMKFTQEFMDKCYEILGQRFMLQNNSLRYNLDMITKGTYGDLYRRITAMHNKTGIVIGFQCAAPSRVIDLPKAVAEGIKLGGCYAEVPVDFRNTMSIEQARELDKGLRDNCSR